MPWNTQYFLFFPLVRIHINLLVYLLANMRSKAVIYISSRKLSSYNGRLHKIVHQFFTVSQVELQSRGESIFLSKIMGTPFFNCVNWWKVR